MMTSEFLDLVAEADPLGADMACHQLPRMNDQADTTALARTLFALVPSEPRLGQSSLPACAAAMRDIGMFLGSLKRHGIEPVIAVPPVEGTLLLLRERTAMVPRDTVYHYGPWNPRGARERRYTGSPHESILIEAVRTAAPALERTLYRLEEALEIVPVDPEFALACHRAADELEEMVRAIDRVRSGLPPYFFAQALRPYFEEITVGGHVYLGPAAAHLPLYLVDHVLWSSDRPEPSYVPFQEETLRHALPSSRTLFERTRGQSSLATKVIDALGVDPWAQDQALRSSVEALRELFRILIVFRARHLALARREYQKDIRLYSVGSGGASIDLVRLILDLTRACAASLKDASIPNRAPAAPDAEAPVSSDAASNR